MTPIDRRRIVTGCVAIFLLATVAVVGQGEEARAQGPPVRIELRTPSGEAAVVGPGTVVTVAGEGMEPRRLPIPDATFTARLPQGSNWSLCLEAEETWAACRTLEAEDASDVVRPVTFIIWPAAELSGEIRLESEEEVPTELDVKIGPPPVPGPPTPLEKTTLQCPVAAEGRFRCSVPATPFFAAVRRTGFVSRYFWDLAPVAGQRIELGSVKLARGASLIGSVDLSPEGLSVKGLQLRLLPAVSSRTPVATAGRAEQAAQSASVTPHGFFQFSGVAPGAYMLEASHSGFATAAIGPVEVSPGKETEVLAPLQLLPPIQLDILIDPPLAHGGRRWRVEVFRARDWSAGSDRIYWGEASPEGSLRIPNQSPGSFSISISDNFGNRFYDEEVRLEPGDSGFVPIEVSTINVTGLLRLGSEPIQGWLMFGGSQGAERSKMRADDEGRFAGLLPRDGNWEVEVRIPEPAIETFTRVDVVAETDGTAEVAIDVDDTELFGKVIDPEGKPVPGAAVKIEALGAFVSLRRRTDEQGEFHFRGVPAGSAVIAARAEIDGVLAMSDPERVTLQEDVATGPVDLVLESFQRVSGRVLSSTGPAVGAPISAVTLGLASPASDYAVTDNDGAFTLRLPKDAPMLGVVILPPGAFLTTATVPAQGPLELHSASRGGTLMVRSEDGQPGRDVHLLVEREGVAIDFRLLDQWSRGHGVRAEGSTVHFPRMAEGGYRACLYTEEARKETIREGGTWQDVLAGATRCARGFLPAGGELTLAPGSD